MERLKDRLVTNARIAANPGKRKEKKGSELKERENSRRSRKSLSSAVPQSDWKQCVWKNLLMIEIAARS